MILSKRQKIRINIIAKIRGNDYNPNNGPIQSEDLASRLGVPKRQLEQDLQKMVRAGILIGIRGPAGGYSLAKTQITLLEALLIPYGKAKAEPTHGDSIESHIQDVFNRLYV